MSDFGQFSQFKVLCRGAILFHAVRMSGDTFFTEIEFARIPDITLKFGIGRSTIYQCLNEGLIKSKYVRTRGSKHGLRLIDLNSVRAMLASAPDKPSKSVSREMKRRALASADARAAAARGE